jgi:hypothetical protein
MSNVHVVKKNSHWETKIEGNKDPVTKHHTQENAAKQGKKIVIETGGGELVVHGKDNKIREKNTYDKPDKYPPKG